MNLKILFLSAALVATSGLDCHAQSWSQLKQAGMWKEAWALVGPSGERDPRYYVTMRGFAQALLKERKTADAEALYRQALDGRTAADNTDRCACLADYATLLREQKKDTEAQKIEQLVITLHPAADQAVTAATAATAATADAKPALPEDKSAVNNQHNQALKTAMESGNAAFRKKDYAAAKNEFQKSLQQAETFGKYDSRVLDSLGKLIQVSYATHDYPGADALFRRSIDVLKHQDDQSADYANALTNHGKLLRMLNKKPEAMQEEYLAQEILLKHAQASCSDSAGSSGASGSGPDGARQGHGFSVTSGVGGTAGLKLPAPPSIDVPE